MNVVNVVILVLRNPMLYAAITPILGVFGFTSSGLVSTLTLIGAGMSTILGLVVAAIKEIEAKRVQAALGVKEDGYLGKKTVAAASTVSDQKPL
jgi:hypothetical protein